MRTELPESFKNKMKYLLKEEAEDFFLSYERERFHGLRRNPLKIKEEAFLDKLPFTLEKIPWAAEGYYVSREQRPGRHVLHEAGAYYLQEPSAMAAAEVLSVRPGEIICDLCAAPGGKTTQIAGKQQGEGLLVSNEIHPARAKILSRNVERLGLRNTVVLNETPERLSERFFCFFDKVLVDAPCSGEGMFHKELEENGETAEWSEDLVAMCAQRQREILDHAADLLRHGGVMVYSTCTFSPEENEQVIASFCADHPEFSLEEIKTEQFESGRAEWLKDVPLPQVEWTKRLWPHRLKGEGHFVARLRKEEGLAAKRQGVVRRGKEKKMLAEYTGFAKEHFVDERMFEASGSALSFFGDTLYAVPQILPKLDGLRVVRPGLELGKNKKNRFEPSHALGMALKREEVTHGVSLSLEEAEHYQKGESVVKQAQKGWSFLEVEGIPMGIGKSVNGIIKNHYPKGIRW